MIRACYYLCLLTIAADLGYEINAGDWWRSILFAGALACLLGLRHELTTEPR